MGRQIEDPNHIYSDSGEPITINCEEAYTASEGIRTVSADQATDSTNLKLVNDDISPNWGGPSAASWYGAAKTLEEYLYACRLKLSTTSVEMVRINNSFVDTDDASADRAANLFEGIGQSDCEDG